MAKGAGKARFFVASSATCNAVPRAKKLQLQQAPRTLIFGGTTEGRLLCEACSARGINAIYCVATELGAIQLPGITPRVGRLDTLAMAALIQQERPVLVLDATHPYAAEVSANILAACTEAGVPLARILRDEGEAAKDCHSFSTHRDLVAWLAKTSGMIFVTTGAKEAAVFTGLSGFQERVWFRMLPDIGGLQNCLNLGYPASRIICMQGPFSRELNRAMFAAAAASILVTKNSGAPGGFAEKLAAARDLGMRVALLARPPDPGGVPLERAIAELERLAS